MKGNLMTPTDYATVLGLIAITALTVWNIHNRQIVNASGVTVQDLKPLPPPQAPLSSSGSVSAFNQYATKFEVEQLAKEVKEAWVSINNNSVKHATDQIESEKKFSKVNEEVQTLHSRLNDVVKNRKAEPKQVVVHHNYSMPMQVDLIYPEKVQSKGKGKGALLRRASQ